MQTRTFKGTPHLVIRDGAVCYECEQYHSGADTPKLVEQWVRMDGPDEDGKLYQIVRTTSWTIVLRRTVFRFWPSRRKPWGVQPWTRAGGDCVCKRCGKEYRRHPTECGPGYGSCGDDILYLQRLCDGSLVHL